MFINQILTKLKSSVYSKSETDSLLNGKASSSHTHTKSQITDFPTIPTDTNQLTNGAGFITSAGSCNYANSAGYAGNGVESYGKNHIRFINGIQICWGAGGTIGQYSVPVVFEKPFNDTSYRLCAIGVISTSDTDYRQTISILYDLKYTTGVELRLPNASSPNIDYIAIGTWK